MDSMRVKIYSCYMATVVVIVNGCGLSCYNWSPQNWSPGPFLAATAGPPRPFAALQMVSQTNYGTVVSPPLPQLVPRILLFIEP